MSDIGDGLAAAFKIMFIVTILVTVIVTASVTWLAVRWATPAPQVAPVTEVQEQGETVQWQK